MKKNNTGLIVFVIMLFLLVVGLGGFIVYDKLLSNNKVENNDNTELNDDVNNNIVDDDSNSNENLNSIGLDLYKLFTGRNGTGPFNWENGKVVNYVNVITHMTQNYFDLPADDKGFSIPYKDEETGEWKSYGGWGTGNQSKFKGISIEKQEENTITFKITYQYMEMGSQSTNPIEDTDTFVIKKVDGVWKVDRFQLIFGLKF